MEHEKTHFEMIRMAAFGQDIDVTDLWLDEDVSEEELIERDPLVITDELLELAEHPELADPVFMGLPRRKR